MSRFGFSMPVSESDKIRLTADCLFLKAFDKARVAYVKNLLNDRKPKRLCLQRMSLLEIQELFENDSFPSVENLTLDDVISNTDHLIVILNALPQLKILKICRLGMITAESSSVELMNYEHLNEIHLESSVMYASGFIKILESSPKLDTIAIYNSRAMRDVPFKSDCIFEHVTSVKFNYANADNATFFEDLLSSILKSATKLKSLHLENMTLNNVQVPSELNCLNRLLIRKIGANTTKIASALIGCAYDLEVVEINAEDINTTFHDLLETDSTCFQFDHDRRWLKLNKLTLIAVTVSANLLAFVSYLSNLKSLTIGKSDIPTSAVADIITSIPEIEEIEFFDWQPSNLFEAIDTSLLPFSIMLKRLKFSKCRLHSGFVYSVLLKSTNIEKLQLHDTNVFEDGNFPYLPIFSALNNFEFTNIKNFMAIAQLVSKAPLLQKNLSFLINFYGALRSYVQADDTAAQQLSHKLLICIARLAGQSERASEHCRIIPFNRFVLDISKDPKLIKTYLLAFPREIRQQILLTQFSHTARVSHTSDTLLNYLADNNLIFGTIVDVFVPKINRRARKDLQLPNNVVNRLFAFTDFKERQAMILSMSETDEPAETAAVSSSQTQTVPVTVSLTESATYIETFEAEQKKFHLNSQSRSINDCCTIN